MANLQKRKKVDLYTKLLSESKNIILFRFGNSSHKELENLRNNLKKYNSKIKIVKNTLFKKAVCKLANKNKTLLKLKKTALFLRHNTAFIKIDKNWSEALKELYKFGKNNQTFEFKAGLLDSNLYLDKQLTTLALLPSKNELRGQVIRTMKGPVNKFVYSLKFNINKLVYILKEKSKEEN